ncbi:MAG: hypothetical protein VX265_07610 [Myxococcota bacterium]|nr:hypothetical protein [Myxococcota bacterium]
MRSRVLAGLPWLIAGCGAGNAGDVVVHVPPAHRAVFARYLAGVPGRPGLALAEDPVRSAGAGVWDGVLTEDVRWPGSEVDLGVDVSGDGATAALPAMQVAVVEDLQCTECYELTGEGRLWTVHAGDLLGAQYGLTHLLELWGYRFFHPFAAHKPATLSPLDGNTALDVRHRPEIARRGLHLHTLHPIEGLDAFWLPGARAEERAARILDWAVKSRANHIQWVSLDDITDNPGVAARWQEHTRAVVDMAHQHGLTTGMGIQLFGASNLQNAFDLVDGAPEPGAMRAMMEDRLSLVTGVGLDELNLSFGEFFTADPDEFVAAVDRSYEIARAQDPDLSMSTVVHVGDGEDQKVTYQGEEMIYYFLAQYADPEIKPWVHTTMYYNLFEDAGGAYHHDEFDAHRELLLQRIRDDQPVGYFPETAYWVAFDDSVPMYLPTYIRSRWLDLARIRDETAGTAGLQDHVLFSTGWEWGYWQNDYTALRMSWGLRPWETEVAALYAPWGDDGAALGRLVTEVADLQAEYLIKKRLTPYLAGRDVAMEAGFSLGVVAQPDRYTFAELADLSGEERDAFAADVLGPLLAYADAMDARGDRARVLADAHPADPWFDEMADAMQVTHLRARYAYMLWSAAWVHAEGGNPTDRLETADRIRSSATDKVADRHAALWDPDGRRMTSAEWANPTIYDYGYLHHADTLCYWEREWVEARRAMAITDATPPNCL